MYYMLIGGKQNYICGKGGMSLEQPFNVGGDDTGRGGGWSFGDNILPPSWDCNLYHRTA